MTFNSTQIVYVGSHAEFINGVWKYDGYVVIPLGDRDTILYGPNTYNACVQWRKRHLK